ncbi:hypothetical protein C8Q74DRAFT_532876 [Fomes fomentarius]|nr:hypothetical protein C8Q74DRAFT_532876 [Fomes fomentarius]
MKQYTHHGLPGRTCTDRVQLRLLIQQPACLWRGSLGAVSGTVLRLDASGDVIDILSYAMVAAGGEFDQTKDIHAPHMQLTASGWRLSQSTRACMNVRRRWQGGRTRRDSLACSLRRSGAP